MPTSTPPPAPRPDWQIAHLTETFKALHTIGVEALKMLALINGGAAVAVLTYVGNAERNHANIADLMPAIFWYSGGLIATTLAFIVGYVTELKLYN